MNVEAAEGGKNMRYLRYANNTMQVVGRFIYLGNFLPKTDRNTEEIRNVGINKYIRKSGYTSRNKKIYLMYNYV